MSEMERRLFGYGTFRDPQWRRAILGADYSWEPASLSGWRRVAIPERGYLSLERSEVDVVDGVLIELDDIGWRIADAWEEVPIYQRVAVEARSAHGIVPAFAYMFDGLTGAQPIGDDAQLAVISRSDVEDSIRAFQRIRDALRVSPSS